MSKSHAPGAGTPGDTCAYCGCAAEGNYSIHRDGFCLGPEVPLCDGCGQDEFPGVEVIWTRISTWVRVPNEVCRRLAEQYGVIEDLHDLASERSPKWFVALCLAWSSATIWTSAHRSVSFAELLDRSILEDELHAAMASALSVGAAAFEILEMVYNWEGTTT